MHAVPLSILIRMLLWFTPAAVGYPLEERDHQQRTAMHLAAMSGHAAIIQQLAAAGADINAQDLKGRDPIYTAVLHSHAEAVRALLAAGARPSVTCLDQRGLPPPAAAGALLELLRALLSAAAAADVGNRQKHEALQLAASGDSLLLEGLLAKGHRLEIWQCGLLTLSRERERESYARRGVRCPPA